MTLGSSVRDDEAERPGSSGSQGDGGSTEAQLENSLFPETAGDAGGDGVCREDDEKEVGRSDVPKKKRDVSKHRKALKLFACCTIYFLASIALNSLGVVYSELLLVFNSKRSLTSLIQALCLGIAFGCSSPAAIPITKYGLLLCCFVSGCVSAAGFMAAAFVNSIPAIIALVGGISGLSFSLLMVGCYTGSTQCFQSKKYSSMMLVSLSAGIGGVVAPLLASYLIHQYGWRGCFLLLSGLLLQICPLSLLLGTSQQVSGQSIDTSTVHREVIKPASVFRIKLFWAILVATVFISLSFSLVTMMIVDYGREKDFGEVRSVFLLTTFRLAATLFRPVFVLLLNASKFCSGMPIYIATSLTAGIATLLLPFAESYTGLQLTVAFFGSQFAGNTIMFSIITLDLVGTERFPTAFGAMNTAFGLAFVLSGPFAGFVADVTDSYVWSFVTVGLVTISAGGLLCLAILVQKFIEGKQEKKDDTEGEEREMFEEKALS